MQSALIVSVILEELKLEVSSLYGYPLKDIFLNLLASFVRL
jgi:hypothetical protein